MTKERKILGETRRKFILQWLQSAEGAITGSDLAKRANVSRQVIVQDISILKARKHPIVSTAQGYMYMKPREQRRVQRIIVCQHPPEKTKEELYTFVDHGVTVLKVLVEHAVYGELTGSLMLSSRLDVDRFCEKVENSNAALLSALTDGVHLHLVEADSEQQIDVAVHALKERGFIVED